MIFDKEIIKKDKKFLLIAIAFVIVILALSFIINPDGKRSYLTEEDLTTGESKIGKLVLNEIMTSNKGAYLDKDGSLYDYVEIYNGKDQDINLKNYGLSDVADQVKWTFPNTIVKSKGYVIVFLSGTNKTGLYTNFKMKSSGDETLVLRNPNGKIIDAIKTVSLTKNQVMARNLDGKWVAQTKPTPGYANTIEGQEKFIASLQNKEETKTIAINEIMPNNKGYFKDDFGSYSGFVEVINVSNKTINLKGYSLSNDPAINYKWQFPNVYLKSKEVLLVYTSNRNIKEGILHAGFKLENQNGTVTIANPEGKIIDSVTYQNVPNGMAYIGGKDGYEIGGSISPGYSNDSAGINKFQETLKVSSSLIINEAMNSNYSYLAQNGGNYYDWIELKNNSNETINLKDYYLTTNTDNMKMYQLPDKELKKGEYYIIMASGNTSLSNSSYKHANFKLSEIESIYLVQKDKIIDSIFLSNVPNGYSVGKGTSHGVYYYSKPTPKVKNSNGISAISYMPTASETAGIYNDIKSLKVSIKGQGTIYYTLDGSTPTTSSKVYSGPISLTKTKVLKIMSKESGKRASEVATYSYIINENNHLPVLSLSLKPNQLSNLNNHAWSVGYEVGPTIAEYFEEGKEGFEIPCALQLFGGSTRGHSKKSYEIVFKKKYGAGHLEYQVFDNRDTSYYNSLVLRTGSQDELQGDRRAVIRDLVATSLVDEYTSVDVQAYKSVILYINGSYRGIYFIREKVDEYFISNHYNVDGSKSDLLRIDGDIKVGTATKYKELTTYVKTHSMTNSKYYDYVISQLNLENFVDYWIAVSFTTNYDMVNCRFFSNPNIEDGRWHYVFYDQDFAMYHPNTNYFNFMTSSSGINHNHYENSLIRQLMKNKNFQKYFLERLSYNLKNTWSIENFNAKVDEIYNEVKDDMTRNLKKYNNISMTEWKKQVDYLKTFTKNRHSYIKKQAKSYFGLSTNEYNKYFGA